MIEMTTSAGVTFIVDDDVADDISGLAWYKNKDGYISRKTSVEGRKGVEIILHRVIAGAKKGVMVDHINQNRLDNRRCNLRIANHSTNGMNRKKSGGTASVHKGVAHHSTTCRWQAQIVSNGRRKYLGLFDSEDEAGHAYNKAAIALHGEFACLNPVGHDKPAAGRVNPDEPEGGANETE